MKEQVINILKKFWFVILVGCLFIGVAIYFAWDTNKDKIPAKSANGKDVIFEVADQYYTADDYYNALFNTTSNDAKTGVMVAYNYLQKAVVEQSIDTTDDMEKQAKENAESLLEQAAASGAAGEATIANQLKMAGYEGIDDLEDYFINAQKSQQMITDYVKDNPKLFDEIYEKESPRVISHILIKFDDSENPTDTPTESEQTKMNEVDKALADGTKFSKVASKYSKDTGSAAEGGSLGIQLKSASLVESFKTAAWQLNEKETSEWIRSEYGYHRIYIDTTSKKTMLKEKYQDSLLTAVSTYYPNLSSEIVWKKAEKLKIKIKDKDLEKELKAYMGVE